jgi:TatD DNase family protein
VIDIGANLAHESFDSDRTAVLERAWAAGLSHILITGSSRASNRAALALTRLAPQRLWATAGVHPHHASEWDEEDARLIRELARDPRLVSLGECGLDYFRDLSPRADQQRAFEAQLALAAELGKPLFLHQRDAHDDFLALLKTWRARLGPVVVHCFTDTRAALRDYLALDCHIGITGWVCDTRRGQALRDCVADIPDDRLLVETDAPYLLPHNAPRTAHRRNEPALLGYVVQALAAARDQSTEHVARISAANARACFGLPDEA